MLLFIFHCVVICWGLGHLHWGFSYLALHQVVSERGVPERVDRVPNVRQFAPGPWVNFIRVRSSWACGQSAECEAVCTRIVSWVDLVKVKVGFS